MSNDNEHLVNYITVPGRYALLRHELPKMLIFEPFFSFLVLDLVNPASTVDLTMLSVFLEGVNIHQKHILLIKNLNASQTPVLRSIFLIN